MEIIAGWTANQTKPVGSHSDREGGGVDKVAREHSRYIHGKEAFEEEEEAEEEEQQKVPRTHCCQKVFPVDRTKSEKKRLHGKKAKAVSISLFLPGEKGTALKAKFAAYFREVKANTTTIARFPFSQG